jgi:hypothetical protein
VVTLFQDPVIGSVKIVSALAQSLQNGHELPIAGVVVLFGRGVYWLIKVDQSENADTIVLVENTSNSGTAAVHMEDDRLNGVEMLVHR